jgi:hypothetical protein
MVLDDWENFLCYQDIEDIIAIRTSRINSSIAFKNEFNLLYIYIQRTYVQYNLIQMEMCDKVME